MSGCFVWTLLLVSCIVHHTAGYLQKPLNVKVESRNFSLFLTWLPDPEYPSFVTYKVQSFKTSNLQKRWAPVSGCENISKTECDITCALSESQFQSHKVRVKTVYPFKSHWAESQKIEYIFAVDPEPPYLNVNKEDGSISIDIHIQTPFCIKEIIYQRMLQYCVVISRRYNPNEVDCQQETDESSITMKTHGYIGEYCVAAKTISRSSNKTSTFSQPFCLNFTQKDEHSSAVFFVPPIFIVIGILILSICIYCKSRGNLKEPKALDFSSNKSLQKNPCISDLYSEVCHSLTIHSIAEQDSSTTSLLRNKYDDDASNYPHRGQGYMERPSMQTAGSQSQEYFSSKGLAFNSSSDNSSTGCACPNSSGSVTDMTLKEKNGDQSNSCPKEIDTNVPGNVQMSSSTSMSVTNRGDSLSIMDPNSLGNVPFNTLCIEGESDHIDLYGESNNQCFTDSEDSLDSFSTDYKISDSRYSSQDEKTHKDCNSGYTQRTYMSRRD